MKAPQPTVDELTHALYECMLALSRVAGDRLGNHMHAVAEPAFFLCMAYTSPNQTIEQRQFWLECADGRKKWIEDYIESHRDDLRALREFGFAYSDDDIEEAEEQARLESERRKLAMWNAMNGAPLADDRAVTR